MARDVHWELVCSEKSRPFAIETFRLKVPNGWLYCNTITRARALARDEFSQSMVFVPDQGGADSALLAVANPKPISSAKGLSHSSACASDSQSGSVVAI